MQAEINPQEIFQTPIYHEKKNTNYNSISLKKLFDYMENSISENTISLCKNFSKRTQAKNAANPGKIKIKECLPVSSLSDDLYDIIFEIFVNQSVAKFINHILIEDIKKDQVRYLYTNYETLSYILNKTYFNTHEKVEIIFKIIKLNIDLINNPDVKSKFSNIGSLNFLRQSINCANILTKSNTSPAKDTSVTSINFFNDPSKLRLLADEIENVDDDLIKSILLDINNHLFKEDMTEEDINIVVRYLRTLNLSDELCRNVSYHLNKNLAKKNKKESYVSHKTNISKVETISAKEIKKLWYELSQYFDFNNMVSIKYLTQEEIDICLSKLELLNVPKTRQQIFVQIVLKANQNYEVTPLEEYQDLQNKIMQYGDQLIASDLITLNECLEEINNATPSEKNFYIEMFNMTFKNIIKDLPKDGTYELSLRLNNSMI